MDKIVERLAVGQKVLVQIFPNSGKLWVEGTIDQIVQIKTGHFWYGVTFNHIYCGGSVAREHEILISVPMGATKDQIKALLSLIDPK